MGRTYDEFIRLHVLQNGHWLGSQFQLPQVEGCSKKRAAVYKQEVSGRCISWIPSSLVNHLALTGIDLHYLDMAATGSVGDEKHMAASRQKLGPVVP